MGKIFYSGLRFEFKDHLHGVRFWKQLAPIGVVPRLKVWRYLGSTSEGTSHLFTLYRGREVRVMQNTDIFTPLGLFRADFSPFVLDMALLKRVHSSVFPK